jgi:hypothetical protein
MNKISRLSLSKFCLFLISFSLILTGSFLSEAKAEVSICLVSPIGTEVYRSGDTMTISWQAENQPVCAWNIAFYYQWSGTTTEHYIGSVYYKNEGSYTWTTPSVSTKSYLQIVARLQTDGGGTCDGGKTVSGSTTIFPSSAASLLYLSNPQPNPCANRAITLSAGETYAITWDISGCDILSQFISIYYATRFTMPGGYNWEHISSVPCSAGHFNWTVPNVDTNKAHIMLEWGDLSAGHIHPFTITPDPVNHCPEADAGSDQTVAEFTTVYLDGIGSHDPEGDDISYHWEIVNPAGYYESRVILNHANSRRADFMAPNVPVNVELDFRLTVTSTYGCDGSPDDDLVTVTVTPRAPSISSFTPREGWFKTPITITGTNLGGSWVQMNGVNVWPSTIPLDEDSEFTFSLPNLSLGFRSVTVGSAAAPYLFEVIDVPYQWYWGFQFTNPGGFLLSWDDYVRCFGRDAVTWELSCCDWHGGSCERACHSPIAQTIFDNYIQDLAWPGSCWGMSVASLKFFYGNFSLPYSGHSVVRDLIWDNASPDIGITMEIRKHHISQISAEVIGYLVDHIADLPSDHLARVIADTAHWRDKSDPDYQPGVISIQHITPGTFENLSGHALVPDHVEEVAPDIYRIYVYDSNRASFSTSFDNTNSTQYATITNFDNYPYITVDLSGDPENWTFDKGDEIWEANSDYNFRISYNDHEYDIPFYGLYYFPAAVSVRDHYNFPLSLRGVSMILSGSADSGIVAADGDRLGYDAGGKLHFEIADGLPISPMGGGSFRDQEFYLLPDGTYEIELYGNQEDGFYNWQCLNKNTLVALSQVPLDKAGQDKLTLGRGNSELFMTCSEKAKNVSVKMVKTFNQDHKTFQRVYEVENALVTDKAKVWFRVTPDLKSLVYENNSSEDVICLARFIQVELGPQPEPPEVPTGIKDLTREIECLVSAGQAMILTPQDWSALSTSTVTERVYKTGVLPFFAADFDFDGDVDGYDLSAFARASAAQAFEADLDSNGEMGTADIKLFAKQTGNLTM